jgi:hypothetical protein
MLCIFGKLKFFFLKIFLVIIYYYYFFIHNILNVLEREKCEAKYEFIGGLKLLYNKKIR